MAGGKSGMRIRKKSKRILALGLASLLFMGTVADSSLLKDAKAVEFTEQEMVTAEMPTTETETESTTEAAPETVVPEVPEAELPVAPEAPVQPETPAPEVEIPEVASPEEVVPEQTVPETQTPETKPEAEVKKQEAMELKTEVKDATGNVVGTVKANIKAETFVANTSEVTMKVSTVDAGLTKTITDLAKKKIGEEKELGEHFLYRVEFQVNGVTTEPGKEVKLAFTPTQFKIEDVKKAKVFYYNEAYSPAGNTMPELVEIVQRAEKLEELKRAGADLTNFEEDYDVTDITLHADQTADKIVTEGRRSTVYGCYLEKDKPEEKPEQGLEDTPEGEGSEATPEDEIKSEGTPEDLEKPMEESPESESTPEDVFENIKPFKYENEDVIIEVSEKEQGAIPEDVRLKVVPIEKDKMETREQYQEVEQKIQEKAAEDQNQVIGFFAYDIVFVDLDGQEIEPNGKVNVSIRYKKAVLPQEVVDRNVKEAGVSVLHLEEDTEGNVKQVVDMTERKEATVETLVTPDGLKVQKLEAETESFSAFTIVWEVPGPWPFDNDLEIDVKYVDTTGEEILTGPLENVSIAHDQTIDLAGYQKEIAGRTFLEICIDTPDGPSAEKIKAITDDWNQIKKVHYIKYVDNAGEEHGWLSDSGIIGARRKGTLYFVYKPIHTSTGSSSGSLGEPTHNKKAVLNKDGSYNLTLDVVGGVGEAQKVDVLFIIDESNSMNDPINNGKKGVKRYKAVNTAIETFTSTVQKSSSFLNGELQIRYGAVEFGTNAKLMTETWKEFPKQGEISVKADVGRGGTNWEAGIQEGIKLLEKSNNKKVVIFLTDGNPTYRIQGGNGSDPDIENYKAARNHWLHSPEMMNSYSYVIDMNGHTGVNRCVALASEVGADHIIGTDQAALTAGFKKIAENITRPQYEQVTITDTLSEYVDMVEGTTPVVKVVDQRTDKDVTESEEKYVKITQSTDSETQRPMVSLSFEDEYKLKDGYKYSVTFQIKTNERAKEAYIEKKYQYPNTGDAETGTYAGEKGFFSNGKAQITYSTDGKTMQGPLDYGKPVVQIPDPPVEAKMEAVNFYLNLNSQMLDADGSIQNHEKNLFTKSVSGSVSGLNQDLKVRLPDDHQHNGNEVVGVIGGKDAKSADAAIRELGKGTVGNQPGQEQKHYQIVDKDGKGKFPSDQEIFEYIRANWNQGDKVNNNNNILVNDAPINVENLTEDNFAIRWYVFKDVPDDRWHIDGLLVPKKGMLTVTKTFPSYEVANDVKNTFRMNFEGDFLAEESTISKSLDQADKIQLADGTIIKPGEIPDKSNQTITYTWNIAIFDTSYRVYETGYETSEKSAWEYASTNWKYTNIRGEVSTSKSITSEEVQEHGTNHTDCIIRTECSDEKTQTFAFENQYTKRQITLDLKKYGTTYEDVNLLDGAKFELYKGRQEKGQLVWEKLENSSPIDVNNQTTELTLESGFYKLKEIEAPTGYQLLDRDIGFKVEGLSIKLIDLKTGTDLKDPSMWMLEKNQDGFVLKIKNQALYELPQSGGTGIYWYLFGGMLLMMAAALIVYKKRRREVLERK